MITITVNQLESKTINSLIDENLRFMIVHDEVTDEEEDKVNVIADKVALLREKCIRNTE